MIANQANFLNFIRKSPQFVIPIYQRNYSWNITQCQQLWKDILRVGQQNNINPHFIGSIVYIKNFGTVTTESLLLIDGQQRLTTTMLLIAALANHFEESNLDQINGFSAKKLRNYYLLNPEEENEYHYKLILSETDKNTLLALLDDRTPQQHSPNVINNYEFFREAIRQSQQNRRQLESICNGLSKLNIVEVALDPGRDDPQLIFESLNSTGLALSQADLIRNYILMGLDRNQQRRLYQNHWRLMESNFSQNAYATQFDSFMRHYLTTKTYEIPNVREVYIAFKQYARGLDASELVSDIHNYATYYCAMALQFETHTVLKQAFHDLRELKVDVAYPFLLKVYHDYQQKMLKTEEMVEIVRLVESYVFRRAICSLPTNSLNKVFVELSSKLNRLSKDNYLEGVQADFLLLQSYRRFPSDEEFHCQLKKRDLYNFPRRSYWLRRLENHERNERVLLEDYTIEHIMPQNEDLSEAWKQELGDDWQRVQKSWLHTLGNLTLTGYNSNYSDRPFLEKRDCKDQNGNPIGFAASTIWLNDGLGQVQKWDEAAIQELATRLANKAVNVWRFPPLTQDVLNKYRPQPSQQDQIYSIDNFPQLTNGGATATLFEALRNRIINLDPCVNEEYRSCYIAYRAETNFVDVVPRARFLRLFLNMPFQQVDDPQCLCRDVSLIGHWGNGDVAIELSSEQDVPYVMGLIRQSFDRQMGDAAD